MKLTTALVAREHDAVTAFEGNDGTRWALGAYAAMEARTIGRAATSRGTRDALGTELVEVSAHGTTNPICQELEGETFPADSAPQPPFHPNCTHVLIPAGFSLEEHVDAMAEVA
jgi:hypothetical protein